MENKFRVVRLNPTILLLLLLLLGCQSREIVPKGKGTEYFPLKAGAYWVYDVVETHITQVGGQTNSAYELKVQITDSILLSGQWSYVMARTKRSDPAQPWAAVDTWSARRDEFQAIEQEGNTPFIKMTFPLSEGKLWNGNALNTLGGTDRCTDGSFKCDNYVMSDLAKRFEGSGLFFDDTVTILENNDNDPIVKQDVRKLVYAKSVGLIYKEISILEYCTIGGCIGQQIVENGSIIKQKVKDYGGL